LFSKRIQKIFSKVTGIHQRKRTMEKSKELPFLLQQKWIKKELISSGPALLKNEKEEIHSLLIHSLTTKPFAIVNIREKM
jgi:hypothetical protein